MLLKAAGHGVTTNNRSSKIAAVGARACVYAVGPQGTEKKRHFLETQWQYSVAVLTLTETDNFGKMPPSKNGTVGKKKKNIPEETIELGQVL